MIPPINQISNNVAIIKNFISQTDPILADYLGTQKTINGTYLSETTARFDSSWIIAPPDLPATSIDNFNFYLNGTLIEKIGIVSFEDFSTYSILTIDPNVLQFSFDSTDYIVSIGKYV